MKWIKKSADKISDRNRGKKYRFFIDNFAPGPGTKILDVGASEKEYQKNANILEKKYPYPENITVLGVDDFNEFLKKYPKVKTVKYEGGIFPFQNKEFDICWCNAVIEHVGGKKDQKDFLKEICRVAEKTFITTPNRYFPWETHTRLFLLHYLPKRIFDKILVKTGRSWAAGNYMNLLSLKDIKTILKDCDIEGYRIVKHKIFFFTVSFAIII